VSSQRHRVLSARSHGRPIWGLGATLAVGLAVATAAALCGGCGSPRGGAVDWAALSKQAAFTLGGGDRIHVEIKGREELTRDLVVRPDGMVTVPLIGDVLARGRLPAQLGDEIGRRIERFVKSPVVTVSLLEVRSYAVYVLGEVRRAGEHRAQEPLSLVHALALAGGLTEFASPSRILILRRQPGQQDLVIPVSYRAIVSGDAPEQNVLLHSGDTVVVP